MEGCITIKKAIMHALNESTGLLIGRFGTIEFDVLWTWCKGSKALRSDMLTVLERNAGVFGDANHIRNWCTEYEAAIRGSDILATGWYEPIRMKEQKFLEGFAGKQVTLRSLEPYYWPAEAQWSRVIKGKVCVVSSFADTIMSQVKKDIFPGMFTDVEWSAVRTGYAPSLALGRASWSGDPSCWEDCVKGVVDEVLLINPRLVIIGCGGLGMIIGARLKAAGKICLVLGGATQVLFGIKGQRWANHELSKFWGPDWVWPAASETPAGASQVERGCYWSGTT